jgi:hypothetical protein
MSRREAILSAGLVFLVALAVRTWAATQITFPRPEDVAYYVGVARNLVDGRGLVSDAIWSFTTPPLAFPRPAFEVWLPLPSFLAAIPMALLGTTFAAAQLSSIVVGSIVCVLAWRLGADVAAARSMSVGRSRTLALGAGLASAVYLPLVLASVQPDSTMPFAALVLVACLLMGRLLRPLTRPEIPSGGPTVLLEWARGVARSRARDTLLLGIALGLAALTRNEAIWLALTWAVVAWWVAGRAVAAGAVRPIRGISSVGRPVVSRAETTQLGQWWPSVVFVGLIAMLIFAPWAYRDWVEFGTPFPGQALTNALFLDGRDVFAWQDRPTLGRYLAAGLPALLDLRVTGTVHNLTNVLLLLGLPVSVVGLIGLPAAWGIGRRPTPGAAPGPARSSVLEPARSSALEPARSSALEPARSSANPLRPLILFSVVTFAVASLVFPVATTWGTFLHAAGAIHVLLVISALLVLDAVIGWVGRRRGWTRPVAWLGPAFAIAGCLLFSGVLLAEDGKASRGGAAHFGALAAALRDPAFAMPIDAEPGPIITDVPIWLAESTGHHTLALPNEPADSILDLAGRFDPPARILVVSTDNTGVWPATILAGDPRSECFVPLPLAVRDVLAFRIRCP